jgi:hypothetical protein
MTVHRNDGTSHVLDIESGEGDYSCEGPPHRFIEVIQGQGINDSPGDVGAASVELITAMFRSANNGGQPTSV